MLIGCEERDVSWQPTVNIAGAAGEIRKALQCLLDSEAHHYKVATSSRQAGTSWHFNLGHQTYLDLILTISQHCRWAFSRTDPQFTCDYGSLA